MRSFKLGLAFIIAQLFVQCLGQTEVCNGTLKGEFTDIIVEKNESCVLISVTAEAVTVNIDANLIIEGISTIAVINALDDTIITLRNRTTVDTIIVTDRASTLVTGEKTALVKSLLLSKAGATRTQGPSFGRIESYRSGVLSVFFSSVSGEIRVERGVGQVNICGSEIKDRTTVLSRLGDVTFGNFSSGCPGSKFSKAVRVARGDGTLTLQGADAGPVSIADHVGDVSLSLSSFGKISVSDITGDMSLMTSTARKGAELTNIEGELTLMTTGFLGQVSINEETRRKVGITTIKESSFQESEQAVRLAVVRRGRLSISNTNFQNGSVSVARSGPLVFNGNGDVNVTFDRVRRVRVFENNMGIVNLTNCAGGTEIEKNVVREALVESCTDGVKIVQNVFRRRLACFGNMPPPGGKENSVAKAFGQCAKFAG